MSKRYSRQVLLDEVGNEGQAKLLNQHIAIVGCGGLGAIAAAYLAGAGVGSLTLIDGDSPELSNVHRQILYTGEEKESKSKVLKQKLLALNPEIDIQVSAEFLTKENIDEILTGVNLILECTDNIFCKYLVNDYAVIEQVPLIYGAIHKYEGYVSTFINKADTDIHLRDIFPYPDDSIPSCSEVGVLNTIAGVIGLFQANEALKLAIGFGEPLIGKLLTYDCLTNRQLILNTKKSWTIDLEEYFDGQEYKGVDCSFVPEITIKEMIQKRNEFKLISILNSEEHHAIDSETIHAPELSSESVHELEATVPLILYCKTGRESRLLAAKILTTLPQSKIYSLKGGLKAFKKFKALS